MRRGIPAIALIALAAAVAGCSGRNASRPAETAAMAGSSPERTCLVRAMYFESNRSSQDGLMAVGTVVMNRVASPRFPNTICGVVSQHRQFAPGVMTRPLDPRQLPPAQHAADAILAGERYAPVGKAMHFHMASFKNPYPARYVAVAGGNAFYLKIGRRWRDDGATGAIASKAPEVVPVSASSEAALASATPETFLQRLYKNATAVTAGGQATKTCESATGFGATSLACETDAEGR
jgi:spore germination cell wall hydrolase CwlJ-like protein